MKYTPPHKKEEPYGQKHTHLAGIINVLDIELDNTAYALDRLESHFHDALLVNAGNVGTVGTYAEQLRLNISPDERSVVIDYIAERQMVLVNIDVVETAINELLGWDRFSEPWKGKESPLRGASF